jgi:DNA-directed RNA polymerase II subunit RPB7
MQQYLESKLYSDVEGTCSGQFGFIIAVVSISDIGKGMVISGNGQAEFVTRYRAIVFKPFKGEVVDGVVHNVTRVRLYHCVLLVWLLTLSTSQMGIFAEVGPLNCFVSQQVRALSSQVSRRILLVLSLIPENLRSSSILISNLTPHQTHHPILPRIR